MPDTEHQWDWRDAIALGQRRRALGMTQAMLAAALGVSRTTLGKWERSALAPSPERQRRIRERFVDIDAARTRECDACLAPFVAPFALGATLPPNLCAACVAERAPLPEPEPIKHRRECMLCDTVFSSPPERALRNFCDECIAKDALRRAQSVSTPDPRS